MNNNLSLGLELTPDQAQRAARIACRDAGHDVAECDEVEAHIRAYAKLMLAKHIEMTERQIAQDEMRAALAAFDEPADEPIEED